MFSGLESGFGLDVVAWLQAHGNGLFDAVGIGLHAAGGTLFYMVMLSLIFWAVNRPLGLRLLFALILAATATEALKELFQTPRPYLAFPDRVTALVDQTGYGLPSGHILIGTAVWGTLAVWSRRRAVTAAVVAYLLLMGWSRMYVGVHYPQDVIAGAIFGGLLLGLYARFADDLAARWRGIPWPGQAALIVLGSVLIFVVTRATETGQAMTGVLLGCGLGLIGEERVARGAMARWAAARGLGQRMVRAVGGLGLTLLVYLGLSALFAGLEPAALLRVVRYACMGAVAMALWPWLCLRLGLAEAEAGGDQ